MIRIEARDKVLRLPSFVYWAGLERHGIRLFPGSLGRYHASLDAFYTTSSRRSEGDESERHQFLLLLGATQAFRGFHIDSDRIRPIAVGLLSRQDFGAPTPRLERARDATQIRLEPRARFARWLVAGSRGPCSGRRGSEPASC